MGWRREVERTKNSQTDSRRQRGAARTKRQENENVTTTEKGA